MESYFYLACPYSHPEAEVRHARYEHACRALGEGLREGLVLYSPVVHWHPLACSTSLPFDWAFWWKHNSTMLHHSRGLVVLRLQGWSISKGVKAEVDYARELELPIIWRDPQPA